MKVTLVCQRSNPIKTAKVEKCQGLGIKEQIGILSPRSIGVKPGSSDKKSQKPDLGSLVQASRNSHMTPESQGPRWHLEVAWQMERTQGLPSKKSNSSPDSIIY